MSETKYPFYAKATIILFGLMLTVIALIFGREIMVPLIFAALLATLLNPVLRQLERTRMPRLMAILLTVLLALVIVVGIAYFITYQLSQFSDALPVLKMKLLGHFIKLQYWFENLFGITADKQMAYVRQVVARLLENGGLLLSNTFAVITDVLVLVTLIPVYVFLFLLYQDLLVAFVIRAFSGINPFKVSNILHEIKQVIQSYIIGLLIEAVIVAFMNSVGLALIGIDYAILLGIIGALLNMVPYLGGIIAITLPVLVAIVTKDGLVYPLAIVLVYMFIQFIDNNILVPRIVASKVRINALISILAVLVGGALWGISGMFLSIPVVAIMKIIFDRVPPLKPWGMLLGDEIPDKTYIQAASKLDGGLVIFDKPE